MSVLRDFIDSNSHTVGGGLSRPRRRNLQSRNSRDDGMTMLVFGFHQGPDFVNAEMALRRPGAPAGPAGRSRELRRQRFRGRNPARATKLINVVFTRIVNDYSTVHGTTAVCLIRGELHEPVNLGS
jgi:hypothetical protein